MIPRLTTSAYPTRYAAFDHPGHLVVLAPDSNGAIQPCGFSASTPWESWTRGGGREMAVFSESHRNRDWPACSDGVYLEIRSQRPEIGGFVVDGHVSSPTLSRLQGRGLMVPAATMEEALEVATLWIEGARAWVAHRLAVEKVVQVGDRRFVAMPDADGHGWEITRANGDGRAVATVRPQALRAPQGQVVEVLDWTTFRAIPDDEVASALATLVSA